MENELPTPYNLSAIAWFQSAREKLEELLATEELTDLADISNDIYNGLVVLGAE